MRKIFILITVVLLVGLIAAPAFAIGGSGSDDQVWYPVFSFDTVEWDDLSTKASYSIPYPFNSGIVGDVSDYSYFDDLVYGHQGMGEDPDSVFPRIVGSMNNALASPSIGVTQSITFKAGHQVINGSDIDGEFLLSYDPDDIKIINTVFSAVYYTMVPDPLGSGKYIAKSHTFSWTEAYYPNDILDFSYCVRKLVDAAGAGGRVFLDSCSFTINFSRQSVDTTSFGFLIGTNGSTAPNRPSDFANWLYFSEVPVSDAVVSAEDVDFMSWLLNSVEAFLQFEMFPGFSIDKLFVIVLVIGILLWFFKVVS